ncbi:MAG: DedA family protein [Proteobacteria bacterium]|nr:DedA family protein [Pseudomonadota bacterium]MDA0849952.1 DedA family protein [Pseudomonadota bacterium]MDA1294048.1 DedA family protein [Pseudomonadota bacterium]
MYLSLFISAFAAATILPAQSEALLAYQVSISPDAVVQLIAVATLGNVLGATFNWCLGRLTENLRAKKWFPVNEKQLQKAERFYGRYGRYSLLLSWVPIIGDPITIVAGILREPLLSFVLLVTIAKCARYVFVVGLAAFLL